MYSMVTVSPTLGTGPLPSARTVLLTPIAAAVAVKLRYLEVEEAVDVESLASLVVEESRSCLCR